MRIIKRQSLTKSHAQDKLGGDDNDDDDGDDERNQYKSEITAAVSRRNTLMRERLGWKLHLAPRKNLERKEE